MIKAPSVISTSTIEQRFLFFSVGFLALNQGTGGSLGIKEMVALPHSFKEMLVVFTVGLAISVLGHQAAGQATTTVTQSLQKFCGHYRFAGSCWKFHQPVSFWFLLMLAVEPKIPQIQSFGSIWPFLCGGWKCRVLWISAQGDEDRKRHILPLKIFVVIF